jgi:alkaline phosphatase D
MALPRVTALFRISLLALLSSFMAVGIGHAEVLLPDKSQLVKRVAFGSCAFQSVEQPIFRQVVASRPDLYLSLGDAIYGDYDLDLKQVYTVTPETLRREWQVLAANPDWQNLVANVPVMATWDNHDYGHHNAGADFPLKDVSAEIFLDFFGEPARSDRRHRQGIYDAKVFGPTGRRLQIILLDTRSFKSSPVLADRPEGAGGSLGKYAPNSNETAALLGAAQWQWLAEQLRAPAEIRLIASSGQIVADQKGMDEWGNYPLERERLFQLLGQRAGGELLLLSGNAHFAEVSAMRAGGERLLDFTSSGLTHINADYAQAPNRYRVAGPVVEPHFGIVEIEWEPEPGITLKVINASGNTVLEYVVRK